jgi:hypothetical protein
MAAALNNASTARWVALAEQFAPDLEASAAASSARYSAMAAALGRAVSDASTARWIALGKAYAPDYEKIAAASAARWTALADHYTRGVAASAD